MVRNILRFPSDEWIKTFKEELNKNKTYQEAAKDWEGDFLFVITPDEDLMAWEMQGRVPGERRNKCEVRVQGPLFELEESHPEGA